MRTHLTAVNRPAVMIVTVLAVVAASVPTTSWNDVMPAVLRWVSGLIVVHVPRPHRLTSPPTVTATLGIRN